MHLEYVIVLESEEVCKIDRILHKGHRIQLEGSPASQLEHQNKL